METTLTARSVILSLLLGTRPASLPVHDLVRLGQEFDISPPTLRVALSRMVASGDLSRNDAIYSLPDRHLVRQAAQDADLDPVLRPYDGSWDQFVVTASGRDATTRADVRSRLTALRLAELREGVWMRPANLVGVDAPPPGVEHFTVRPADDLALAERLWDCATWSRTADHLLEVARTTSTLRDRFLTMTAIVRHLRADPYLPPALQPTSWPAADLRQAYETFRTELMTLRSPQETR
ncbi:PaaX domain-containing protein, C- domain protein [Aeromicrobium sp. CF3.5]|uniref:PaaX domain-containing protein, C- domain protein n=1 Tax=Aeromicrobium sp. CF3.5 TaxID=3373078 RepID=UPI003EE4E886